MKPTLCKTMVFKSILLLQLLQALILHNGESSATRNGNIPPATPSSTPSSLNTALEHKTSRQEQEQDSALTSDSEGHNIPVKSTQLNAGEEQREREGEKREKEGERGRGEEREEEEGRMRPKQRRHRRSSELHEAYYAAPVTKGPLTLCPANSKLHTLATQNFTLSVQSGHVVLFYGPNSLIDLTSPEKLSLSRADMLSYRGGIISITTGVSESRRFPDIENLVLYNGTRTHILTRSSGDTLLTPGTSELLVSTRTAFLSCSAQFNALLDRELGRVLARRRERPAIAVEIAPLLGGIHSLVVDRTSIVILTGAESRTISRRHFLIYTNNTIHVRREREREVVVTEVFLEIETLHLLAFNDGHTRLSHALVGRIPGGGDLHVHMPTRTAFYSSDAHTNKMISKFLESSKSDTTTTAKANTGFSIRVEVGVDAVTSLRGGLEVVVVTSDGGEEVVRLKPSHTVDQSVAPQHYVIYHNNTLKIVNGDSTLDVIPHVLRLRVHSGEEQLVSHMGSLPRQLPGGGQLFVCRGLGLYSSDTTLTDRIGDTLMAAETYEAAS